MCRRRLTPGKRYHYEEDTAVPFFIRGPGITPGSMNHQLATIVDIAPTMVKLAGGALRPDFDGVALEVVAPEKAAPREFLLTEEWNSVSNLVYKTATVCLSGSPQAGFTYGGREPIEPGQFVKSKKPKDDGARRMMLASASAAAEAHPGVSAGMPPCWEDCEETIWDVPVYDEDYEYDDDDYDYDDYVGEEDEEEEGVEGEEGGADLPSRQLLQKEEKTPEERRAEKRANKKEKRKAQRALDLATYTDHKLLLGALYNNILAYDTATKYAKKIQKKLDKETMKAAKEAGASKEELKEMKAALKEALKALTLEDIAAKEGMVAPKGFKKINSKELKRTSRAERKEKKKMNKLDQATREAINAGVLPAEFALDR